jgi:hypothetical protein
MSQINPIHITATYLPLTKILIFFSHLLTDLPRGHFLSVSPTTIPYELFLPFNLNIHPTVTSFLK